MPEGKPEIFSSSLTQLEYIGKLAFFLFFIISSPLVRAISPSEKAVAIGSFFFYQTQRNYLFIYYLFLWKCFECANDSS